MTRIRYCDGVVGIVECLHPKECRLDCQHNNSVVTRTIKPYPIVPDDIEPVSEELKTIGMVTIHIIMAALVIVFLLIFFSGVYLWNLLI